MRLNRETRILSRSFKEEEEEEEEVREEMMAVTTLLRLSSV